MFQNVKKIITYNRFQALILTLDTERKDMHYVFTLSDFFTHWFCNVSDIYMHCFLFFYFFHKFFFVTMLKLITGFSNLLQKDRGN